MCGHAATRALVVGAIHGDEGAGRAVVRALVRSDSAPAGTQAWLVSTANPDGSARRTRGNARGVDLNRTFPRGWRASPPAAPTTAGPGRCQSPRRARCAG